MRKRNLPEALASRGHLGTLASPDSPGERESRLSYQSIAMPGATTVLFCQHLQEGGGPPFPTAGLG